MSPKASTKATQPPAKRSAKQTVRAAALAQKPAAAPPHLLRTLPIKSAAKAKTLFRHFQLSRFRKNSRPPNFVTEGKAKDPVAVMALHRKVIAQSLRTLKEIAPVNSGITVALPPDSLSTLLPGLGDASGRMGVDELLTVLKQRMQGTEFYASGNPTLNRLSVQSAVENQVQDIIAAIKGGKTV